MVIKFNFLKYRKIYFIFSGSLILASVICLIIFGLKLGIDFTGGSILELEFKEKRPSNQEIQEKLIELNLEEIYLQSTNEKGIILRMKEIDEETHQKILEKLGGKEKLIELRFESIGPVIGKELREKTKILITLSLLAIVVYIGFAFRKIRKPIHSWQCGLVAIFCLFHDILLPLGVFSILGKFFGIQITIPVIVALLTVLGYSINNTVVVYDRIRENLLKKIKISFEEAINFSLNQTLTRQINTSLTTLFVLMAIFFFGSETLRYFTLALTLGILAGTYSSFFLASPILIIWLKWKKLTKDI